MESRPLAALLQEDPDQAMRRLESVVLNQASVPGDFIWHGLAQDAALNAVAHASQGAATRGLRWALIAARVYQWLATESDDYQRELLEVASTMLRVQMIRWLGPREGHPILAPDAITRWFRNRLPMSIAELRFVAPNDW